MNKTWWITLFTGISLGVVIIALILSFGGKQQKEEVLVGVIMPGNVTEVGWNSVHYNGIREAAEDLGAKILLVENVKEGSGLCAKAIDSLIQEGAKMIILGSYNYSSEVADVIRRNPQIRFFCCAADVTEKNYRVYFARIYQARYLSGIIAGLSTKNNRIGYVAAMNNSEVNRGINAFTLGVQSVNPKAKVYVTWTGAWDDVEKETENVDKLVDSVNVDLITYHQNQDWVLKEAERRGILSIGYNLTASNYSANVVTSVMTNWKFIYREIIQDFLQGKQNISNYWIGIEKDSVGLAFYSSLVSDSAKSIIDDVILQMKNGMDIFRGPIFDNAHKKRCGKDETISDSVLRESMDWFVNGVIIYEK